MLPPRHVRRTAGMVGIVHAGQSDRGGQVSLPVMYLVTFPAGNPLPGKNPLFPVNEQPIVADKRQDAITRVCLTLAVIDGPIVLFTVIVPLFFPGENAYREQLILSFWPPFTALFIPGIWFVCTLQKVGPGLLQRRGLTRGGGVAGPLARGNGYCLRQ